MQRYSKFIIVAVIGILLSVGVWAVSVSVTTQKEIAGDASLYPSCAPWGGSDYQIRLNLPQATGRFEGAIWGEGINSFREGKAFTIDNVSSVEGTGHALIFTGKDEKSESPVFTEVAAELSPPDGGNPEWTITIRLPAELGENLTYRISPAIPMIEPLCR